LSGNAISGPALNKILDHILSILKRKYKGQLALSLNEGKEKDNSTAMRGSDQPDKAKIWFKKNIPKFVDILEESKRDSLGSLQSFVDRNTSSRSPRTDDFSANESHLTTKTNIFDSIYFDSCGAAGIT
jgi:hypothetical protein